MTQPVDVAYVDIVVREKSLAKVRRDIKDTLDDIDKDIERDLGDVDDSFAKLFEKIDERFHDLERSVDGVFDEIQVSTDHVTASIERNFSHAGSSVKKSFRNVKGDVEDALDDAERHTVSVFRRIGDAISDVGRTLGQLIGQLGSFVSSNPLLLLLVLLVPAIIAVSAALANLIGLVGLLPAGLGVLLAAIIPTVVAFQNFGEAVSALASGDIEKINEALKKLSPSARQVAREVAAALPALRSFQRVLQEAFFSQVRGAFTQLLSILPRIQSSLAGITGAMGRFVAAFAEFLASPRQVQVFNELFAATARIIDKLSPVFLRLLDAIGSTVHEALPFVERLAAAFGRALDSFSAFISKAVETGGFDKFIEDAITVVKELFALLRAIGGLIGTLFAGTEQSGHDFITTLTAITNQLNDFFKSAEGQRTLRDFAALVEVLLDLIRGAVIGFELFFTALHFVVDLFKSLGREISTFADGVGQFVSSVRTRLQEFVDFIASIPTLIGNLLKAGLDAVLFTIGVGIGLILFAIQVLPGKIVEFFSTLPERISAIVTQLPSIIANAFQSAVTFARDIIVNGFNAVVDFIASVPSRIGDLIPVFGNAGKNLIQSFMNGFRSVGGFIGDIAGDIVSSVKGFLNRAIDRINSGIAAIDAVLPGDLARIPRLASGAIVPHRPGGILANVGEGTEDEVVSPLSKLMDMIRGAVGGAGVTFGPGAINVSFSGVVPTPAEARATGAAVGEGIISTLTRQRDVRAQVRAI